MAFLNQVIKPETTDTKKKTTAVFTGFSRRRNRRYK